MSDNAATVEAKLPKDLAAEKGLVNVQIDGVWMQVPKGMRMIEACKLAQKEVPHYCYHPKLSAPGNCRMCLVQMGMPPRPAPGQDPVRDGEGYENIGWIPRPVIACANTVGENMGIRTTGELVEKCREGVMEFLLINHPLDCPICDQAGECRLQEFSVEHGKGESRFVDAKVKKPKNVDIGPRVRLDDERCIMCSRCIRFMDEVADDPVLGFTQRGTHTTLTVHPGKRLDSNYSLNTVDICPVGALFAIREGVRNGSIKALLVLGEDLADAGFTAEDLAKPEFIASIQLLAGPTAHASDVVLPGAAFAEKRGSMVNVTGRLQRLNRAVEPIGDAKDDWEILRDLILALQGAKPGTGLAAIEDVFKAMAASVPEFDGLSLSKIGDLGKPVVETGVKIPLLQNERARKAAGLING